MWDEFVKEIVFFYFVIFFLALHTTVCGLAKVAIFTTKLHTKNRTSIIRKIVIRSTVPAIFAKRLLWAGVLSVNGYIYFMEFGDCQRVKVYLNNRFLGCNASMVGKG